MDIPTKWIITWLPNHGYQFPTSKSIWKPNFAQIGRIFVFWRPFWIQNGHHSKPTMDINSQHYNLHGNQISSKSEDFCIWQTFCTLVTMAMATILNFFHGICGKVCPTDSDFFGLSRSTRCGCCSYQVSSISVRRVTCYDHFCVSIF